VRHGHITLNGRKTDIPSCAVKEGDVIAWEEQSTNTEYYKRIVELIQDKIVPSWLSLDRENLSGQMLAPPSRSDIDPTFDEKAIVEYYSR
jgi:small subunit ribosomal protein S4